MAEAGGRKPRDDLAYFIYHRDHLRGIGNAGFEFCGQGQEVAAGTPMILKNRIYIQKRTLQNRTRKIVG